MIKLCASALSVWSKETHEIAPIARSWDWRDFHRCAVRLRGRHIHGGAARRDVCRKRSAAQRV